MAQCITYDPRDIGTISRPSREDRNREGDRWVSLRTLQHTPTTIGEPVVSASDPAPVPHKSVFFHAIDQRHIQARQKTGF